MLSKRRAHTTLASTDVDALRPFYEGVLGFKPRAVRPGAVIYDAGGGTLLAISRTSVPSCGAHTQIAFTVDDIDAEVNELRERGVTFEAYENPKTDGGIASIGPGRAAWFKDPQGNLLAVIEFDDPV